MKWQLQEAEYERLIDWRGSLVTFFRKSPWAKIKLDLARDKDTGRDVSFRSS